MGKEIEMKLLTTQAGCHRLFAARTVTKTALPVTEKRLSLKIYIMIQRWCLEPGTHGLPRACHQWQRL